MLVSRTVDSERLATALERAPAVLLVGPRQAGKTTLVRHLAQLRGARFFDAEAPADAVQLRDPMLALSELRGTVVIDEAQLVPGLFPVLRVLIDRPGPPARFLLLGSASADLVGLSSESLAGRIEILELGGFRLRDLDPTDAGRLWLRGGFPPAYLAAGDVEANAWLDNYATTFLSTDLARLGSRVPTATMRRAWTMLSHFHGQLWSGAEFARALDVDGKSARRYLDQLTDALVVRQLLPWFVNTAKRQVKSPKIYIRDTGVLHRLQFVTDYEDLQTRPIVGASWEGFVIEQIAAILGGHPMYFWRSHQGAEIDVFFQFEGRHYGIEIKRSSAPSLTKAIHVARADLDLAQVAVVYPGDTRYRLDQSVAAIPVADMTYATTAAELVDVIVG